MSIKRKLARIDTPRVQPGFLGRGHTARPVVSGPFVSTDPFIMLMHDILDKKNDEPVGGAHPHAGFETVSLLLEGEIGDDTHRMKGGDFEIMTAGSGVVHTETIEKIAKMDLLQLWLNLPKADRWAVPRLQHLPLQNVPVVGHEGAQIKVYSGSLAGVTSPIQNYTSLIVADIALDDTVTIRDLPSHYNAFLYVIKGSVEVGEDEKRLGEHSVGWLDLSDEKSDSELKLVPGEKGARVILYAGEPTGDRIVSHGPFIADTSEDIQRLYGEYRGGRMKHVSTLPQGQRIFL